MYFVLAYRKTDEKVNIVKDISISTFQDRGDALDEYLHEKQNSPSMRVELLQQIDVVESGDEIVESRSKECEKKKEFREADLRTGMVTKFRNGVKSIVLVDTVRSEETFMSELLLVSKEYASTDIEVYDEDLKHGVHSEFDIVEVRRFEDADDMFKKYDLENDYEELELVWIREEAIHYIIGSILGSTETIMWQSKGSEYNIGDVIEVMDNGGKKRAKVDAVISSKSIRSSSDIIGRM